MRPLPHERPIGARRTAFERRASKGSASFGDPVEEWKHSVRAQLETEHEDGRRASVRLHITLGFVVLAAVVGSIRGPSGWVITVAALGSVLLIHELARALFALARGRSSRISISVAGGETELSGAPLRGVAATVFTVVGSVANLLVAAGAFWFRNRGLGPGAAEFARAAAVSHAAWGVTQLLPIVPFRTGMAISARLAPSLRFAHASGSIVFLVPLGAFALTLTKAPMFLGVLALVVFACAQTTREAYRESCDSHSGVDDLIGQVEIALSKGENVRASELTQKGLATALSARQRERLWKALAWAWIGRRDPFLAHGALLRMPKRAIDVHLLASYLALCNRVDEAVELLEAARSVGHRARETTKLHIDLLFRRGDYGATLSLARADSTFLSAQDREAIEIAIADQVLH